MLDELFVQNIAELGGEPSAEVKEVMGRMIATQAEVEAQEIIKDFKAKKEPRGFPLGSLVF